MLKLEISTIGAVAWATLFAAMMTCLVILGTMFVTGAVDKNDRQLVDKVLTTITTFCEKRTKTHGVAITIVNNRFDGSCYRDR